MTSADGEPPQSDAAAVRDAPGTPPTPRARAKSAVLWGAVGGLTFLVLAQGYLLVGGTLPFTYAGLFPLAGAIAATSGGLAYATEHRLRSKRRT